MEKITAQHPSSQSLNLVNENIVKLKALFPTIVKEGKLDIDELRALLGDYVETNEECYRFTWVGKAMARQEANKPSTGTLRPNKIESKNWDTTENIFIEGDNLEVLKLLQKSYSNQVKMIYIDPPYNTGKDFVYKDNYADNLGNYLSLTGQTDEKGKRLSTNSETDGRYHSNWLNMIYPRLKLARNLLKEDGIIFISIDDNESQNLRKVCDEIFGEENLLGIFLWKRRQTTDSRNQTNISVDHEYILCYGRSNNVSFRGKSIDITKYKNPDKDRRGNWASIDLSGLATRDQRPNLHYDIVDPNSGISYPPNPKRGWSKSKAVVEQMIEEGRILFPKNPEGRPREKKFLNDLQKDQTGFSTWLNSDVVGFTTNGTRELTEILDGKYFDFPKSSILLKEFLSQATSNNDIVLDFFAGSGTIAQALLQLNSEDGNNRRYMLVQLPEPTDPGSEAYRAGYKTIADITKERLRLAGEKIIQDINLVAKDSELDIGFKAFKLDSSNIKSWDGSVENFEQNLFNSVNNIKTDRSEEDVLYEILLKNGLNLALPTSVQTFAGKAVYNIGEGALFICLADEISIVVAESIGKWKLALQPVTCKVIFKDTGFKDIDKTNSIQVLKRYGITEINSI